MHEHTADTEGTEKWNFSLWALAVLTAALAVQVFYARRAKLPRGQILRAVGGAIAGYTLSLSSVFHIYFGEQRAADIDDKHSWDYFVDTYEITVMTELFIAVVFYEAVREKPSPLMLLINVAYVTWGAMWTTGVTDDTSTTIWFFNVVGVALGALWFGQFMHAGAVCGGPHPPSKK